MVGSVSSNSVAMMQQSTQSSSSSILTDAQLATISSTLEQYNSSNLSSDDATSIVEAFQAAGIEPSEELATAMEEAGFDAKEVGDAAGLGGTQSGVGMPPPPPPSQEEETAVTDLLDTLLNLDEEEDDTTTSAVDDIMEYTNRILNLNEESKTEVMDILEKFSINDDGYTETEVSNIVKNSLSSILSDSDNYNKVSFYA